MTHIITTYFRVGPIVIISDDEVSVVLIFRQAPHRCATVVSEIVG